MAGQKISTKQIVGTDCDRQFFVKEKYFFSKNMI